VRLSEIMAVANHPAGCAQTPPDSQVYVDGEVRRVFVGIDATSANSFWPARCTPPTKTAMNIHLAADLIGRQYFIDFVGRAVDGRATTVGGLIGELKTIPEMEASLVQPELWLGRPETPLDAGSSRWRPEQMVARPSIGRIMSTAIETILAMHIDERDLRELEQLQRPGETW
jgi:hypothetical protein